MAFLGFELLFRFVWGAIFSIPFIDRRETSERFLKISFWIVFGTVFCAALMLSMSESPLLVRGLTGLLMALVGMGLYSFVYAPWSRILGFFLMLFSPGPLAAAMGFAGTLNFVSSGLVLGTIFTGQHLGHWYLNVPGLAISEFQRVVKLIIFALALKTAEILWTVVFTIGLSPAIGPFGQMILVTRILFGVLAPWIMAGLIKKTVDARSTQSATGILYATCVMIIIGEACALYLRSVLGWQL